MSKHDASYRLLTYCGLLYEMLLQREPGLLATTLPAVLPVVLYSGVPRWSAVVYLAITWRRSCFVWSTTGAWKICKRLFKQCINTRKGHNIANYAGHS